jgi:peroxiredoxin Q/BCP
MRILQGLLGSMKQEGSRMKPKLNKRSSATRKVSGRRSGPPRRTAGDPLLGRRAPGFALADQDGNTIRLSALMGRPVVLYFYPKDFTSGCTREACDFRDAWGTVRGSGAEVLGVSRDTTDLHSRFVKEYRLPFRLLADTTGAVCRKYGVIGKKSLYGREYVGLIRSTFLVDKTGIIRKAWRKVKVEGHVADVLSAVRKEH